MAHRNINVILLKTQENVSPLSGRSARRLAAITTYDYDLQGDSERCLEAGMDG
jgi:hypothetical protein